MRRAVIVLTALLLVGVGATGVAAGQFKTPLLVCEQGYVGGEFYEVLVPAGATCSLGGVSVTTDVRARAGSTLFVSNSIIGGKLKANDSASVEIRDTVIGTP